MSEYIYQSRGEPLVNERGEIYLARAGEIVRCRDCVAYEPYHTYAGMKLDYGELLPCPFCGGEAEICHVTQIWEPRDSYWARCCDCKMSGKHHRTEAEAIAAWNSRAERTCFADEVTHRDCKYSVNRGWRERTCKMETDHDELEVIAYSHEDTWAYKCSACDWSFRYDRGIKPSYCPNCGAKVADEKERIEQ